MTESDELWPIAMERLSRLMNAEIESQLNHPRKRFGDDPRPEQLVEASHKDVVFSDSARWDAASIEQIRERFSEYLRAIKRDVCGGCGRFGGCLVIDERSLKSIVATDGSIGFVGMVDGQYNATKKHDMPYNGFMRVQINVLWWLYLNLDMLHMEELCPVVPNGLIPVYDGGDGKAQDEDGNIDLRKFAQERPSGLAERRVR